MTDYDALYKDEYCTEDIFLSEEPDGEMNDVSDYSDIINVKWPDAKIPGREKMPLNSRAKIFLPFAALTGFEEEIEKRKNEIQQKFSDNIETTCVKNIDT